jgi:hypothetical protein
MLLLVLNVLLEILQSIHQIQLLNVIEAGLREVWLCQPSRSGYQIQMEEFMDLEPVDLGVGPTQVRTT